MVEVVDDLLPMERRLQLMHNLDEQLHVPRLRLGRLGGGGKYQKSKVRKDIVTVWRDVEKGPDGFP